MKPGPRNKRINRKYSNIDRIKVVNTYWYKYSGLYFKPEFLIKLNKGLTLGQFKSRIYRLLKNDGDITSVHKAIFQKPYESRIITYPIHYTTRKTKCIRGDPREYFLDVDDEKGGKIYHEWYLLKDLTDKDNFPECVVTLPGLRCRMQSGRYPDLYSCMTGEISSPNGGRGKTRTKTEPRQYEQWLEFNKDWIGVMHLWQPGSLSHTVKY